MKLKFSILFFLMFSVVVFAQKDSMGDYYYFEYAYKKAISEYKKELSEKNLTNQQYLNLADSYLKTKGFKNAADIYKERFEKDSSLANTHLNKLLLAIGKTDSLAMVKHYLSKFASFLSKELLGNAEFNFELIEKNDLSSLDFYVFNCYLNSAQADFSPAFYKDKLLFTSGRPKDKKKIYQPSGEAYLDIYSGQIQPDGDVTVPKEFKKIPYSNFHKATPYYSEKLDEIIYTLSNADGDELLFDKNGKNTLAIGLLREKGRFEYLLKDLSTSFYYPFYEGTTDKLYFSANFAGGFGGTDIYYVNTNNGQIMSAPVNLGPRINSPGNEIAPFVFEGSLYFSSDIFYGLGGMDIYTSNMQKDGGFSIPVNLGKGINSMYDDFGFIIKDDSKGGFTGYFSSNRGGGKGKDDIYGYKVAQKPGLKTLVITGFVVNPENSNKIENVVVSLMDENKKVLKEVISDENGKYNFEIPFKNTYQIKAYKKGHGVFSELFKHDDIADNSSQNLIINLPFIEDLIESKENKTALKIKKFYFKEGSSIITPAISVELDKVVAVVGNFPKIKLKIESHTSSRGNKNRNLEISQSRANAMRKYLVDKGVGKENILETVGYGESNILNQCKDGVFCLEFLHNQNDRSLISVLNYNELH